MRNGIADAVLIALIGFGGVIVGAIFEKETDGMIVKVVYPDENRTKCYPKQYPEIILTDK